MCHTDEKNTYLSYWHQYALLHDLLVVQGVPDVNVGSVWDSGDSGVKIDDIRRNVALVYICINSLRFQLTDFC
jgi:hypothetical protein